MAKAIKKCNWCGEPLPSHRRKFCSTKCNRKWHAMMQGTDSFLIPFDDGGVSVAPDCNPDYMTSDDLPME